jgi:heparin binding hemagglutinin HbhA
MMATTTKSNTTTNNVVESAFEQARQPFLVALGLSDLATQTTANTLNRALASLDRSGTKAGENADVHAWRQRLADSEFGKLFDPNELRRFFDPEELRGLADSYVKAANDLYQYLAEQGETALGKLREQPGVGGVLGQVDEFYSSAQSRVDEAWNAAEDMLGGLTRSTRSAGEKAARAAERVSTDAAEATREASNKAAKDVSEATREAGNRVSETIAETGEEVAHEARSTSRKAANKTDPNRPANTSGTSGSTSSSGSSGGTSSSGTSGSSGSTSSSGSSGGTSSSGTSGGTRKS